MALRASTDSILLTSLGHCLHKFSHGKQALDRGHNASDTANTAEKVACHCRTHLHMRTCQCDSVLFGLFNTRDKQGGAEDLVTYLLASGTYLSLLLFVFSAAVFLFCLGHLLFIKRKRISDN
jgi:hypothetical protein